MAYSKKEIDNVFESIINRIEDGEAVRTILKESDMPSSQTFYKWIEEDIVKSKRYAHACDSRADAMFEDILIIADASHADKKIVDGQEVVDNEAIQRSRLRVDARKWAVSKLNPKKYGTKHIEQKTEVSIPILNIDPLDSD